MAFKMKKATIYKLVDDDNKKKTLGDVKNASKKEFGDLINLTKEGLKSIANKTYGAAKRGYKIGKAAKTLKK